MTKRIISVLLALVLVLALSTSALAEAVTYDTFDLKINDSEDGRTYEAYQIFKGNPSGEDDALVLTNIEWGTNADQSKLYELAQIETGTAEDVADALIANNELSDKEMAIALAACVTGTPVQTVTTANGEGATFVGLQAGYYIIKETTDDDTVSAFILQVVTDEEVATKRSAVPDYDKKISKDGKLVNESDENIGDVVTFVITAKVKGNYQGYLKYELNYIDTLSEGLTFNGLDTVTVAVKDDEVLTAAIADEYTKSYDDESRILKVEFADLTDVAGLSDKTIVVTYTATLNDKAKIGSEGNDNKFHIEYTNGPETNDKGYTPDKEVTVFTFGLDAVKVDGEEETTTPLAGAEFVLKNAEGEEAVVVDGKLTGWAATGTTLKTETDGKISVDGLEVGNYELVETKAPVGYNKLTDAIEINIARDENDNFVVTVDDTAKEASATVAPTEFQVANFKGTTLPETGGIGTTIFYLVGGLMMAAAVVLLVAKKRTVNE